jgi:diaminopimelate decarboxylase/aspartate kinase
VHPRAASDWVVLKFGGTSVSSAANWNNIASILRERLAEGGRVLVVHSALSGITDQLEKLLDGALQGAYAASLAAIEAKHRSLARDLALDLPDSIARRLEELAQVAAGIALVGEVSDAIRARVMANGELMATELGARFLQAQGLPVEWLDAREVLKAEDRRDASARAGVLSATCAFAPDPALAATLAPRERIVITQGFIASDASGATVLLGRGGSYTSGAYFAAKLAARRLEIWTDVPGLFSANPRTTPSARLLKALHYDEAQEIATNGAKVLHPRCIAPVRQYAIPLTLHDTRHPGITGTLVSAAVDESGAQVKAVCVKKGITLMSLDTPGMWQQVGFLADAFAVFKRHGISIDLVSTSETNVTVTLDPAANTLDRAMLDALAEDLAALCRVQVIGPCASVSLVGRNIRGILHQLGDAFEVFEEQRIHLVSQAANDLNFTFVVDLENADRLVDQLHELLIRPVPGDAVLGPPWEQLFGAPAGVALPSAPWWRKKREALLAALGTREAAFVYDRESVRAAARSIRAIGSISRAWYAMKANPHPEILLLLYTEGLGLESVSRGEVERVREAVPEIDPARILYTPNFAGREEYAWVLGTGAHLTIDSLYPLEQWGELFRGREIFIRVDSGTGRGHHQHVRTAGAHAKFGVPVEDIDRLAALADAAGARVVGLHAHAGSGVFEVDSWRETALLLADLARRFRHVRVINVGGGLGVPDRSEGRPIDLAALDRVLAGVREQHPALEFWLEPGRFLVSAGGVLLARVTQVKSKGEVRYVGVATGMNSLLRPALYGAHHEIVNLTRLEEPATEVVNVVGPICESADVLGHDRMLPLTSEGDVLLIANAGAYGRAMSSSYNLRAPADELLL